MKEVTVLPGQTLSDIVIQEKGSLDGYFDVLTSNGFSPGHEAKEGDAVIIEGEPSDRQRLKYLKRKNIKPATRGNASQSEDVNTGLEGIGYWIIEDDFIVS